MSNSFNRVDNRACKVISGVDLPLGARAVVWVRVGAVDNRISKSLVLVIDRDLKTDVRKCS